jgi:hypothetical protein
MSHTRTVAVTTALDHHINIWIRMLRICDCKLFWLPLRIGWRLSCDKHTLNVVCIKTAMYMLHMVPYSRVKASNDFN